MFVVGVSSHLTTADEMFGYTHTHNMHAALSSLLSSGVRSTRVGPPGPLTPEALFFGLDPASVNRFYEPSISAWPHLKGPPSILDRSGAEAGGVSGVVS